MDLTRCHHLSGPIAVTDEAGTPAQPGDLLVVEICNLGPLPGTALYRLLSLGDFLCVRACVHMRAGVRVGGGEVGEKQAGFDRSDSG